MSCAGWADRRRRRALSHGKTCHEDSAQSRNTDKATGMELRAGSSLLHLDHDFQI
jgi:hypothetical protein